MEESESLSFLDTKEVKSFPRMEMPIVSKPYVSCIKIHGVPILPPLMDDERRREMCIYREQAITIERRLASRRLHRASLDQRNRSTDSGVAGVSQQSTYPCDSRQSNGNYLSESSVQSDLDMSFRQSFHQSDILDYLSAVCSLENSMCSIYKTPCSEVNVSSFASQLSFVQNSIEQKLSFRSCNKDCHTENTSVQRSLESKLLETREIPHFAGFDGNGREDPHCRSSTDDIEESRQTPRFVDKASSTLDLADPDLDSAHERSPASITLTASTDLNPDLGSAHERSPASITLTASTDLNPYLDHTGIYSIESPTQSNRQQDIGEPDVVLRYSSSLEALEHDGNARGKELTSSSQSILYPEGIDNCSGIDASISRCLETTNLLLARVGSDVSKRRLETGVEPELPSEQLQSVSNPDWVSVVSSADNVGEQNAIDTEPAPSTTYENVSQPVDGFLYSSHSAISGNKIECREGNSPLATSSHSLPVSYNLVPPNVSLRPTVSITDWLRSSLQISEDTVQTNPEGLPYPTEGFWNHPDRIVSNTENTGIIPRYSDSDLDLEPSKLMVETVPMPVRVSLKAILDSQQCADIESNSVISIRDEKTCSTTEPLDMRGQEEESILVDKTSPKSVLETDKSEQSKSHPPSMDEDNADLLVPPLIRQNSFTVQAGPSSLLRSYVEENNMELNTGTFENPKQTERVVKVKSSQESSGRKGWDLNKAKAIWGSSSNTQTFAKPKLPASKTKKPFYTKYRTRSVPSINSTSSLPNSATNSPEKRYPAYGSVDGLNYKFQSPLKRPRRSLNFSHSTPRSATKFGNHSHASQVKLVTLPSKKQPTVKSCESNLLTVERERTPSLSRVKGKDSPSNSLKNVPILTKQNHDLPLESREISPPSQNIGLECLKENGNLTELMLHLKTEHNKQMALLLEKQRAEQEKIHEMFMNQQHALIEAMQRSYPEAFNDEASLLSTEAIRQPEQVQIAQRSLSQEESPVVQQRTPSIIAADLSHVLNKSASKSQETSKLLQENVDNRNESSRKARRHNNSVSKDSLASFLSVESLSENESNKENVEEFNHRRQLNFEYLTIDTISLNKSLPHLVISDSDLETHPCTNALEISHAEGQLAGSEDSSCRNLKAGGSLSEHILNPNRENILSPRMYKSVTNMPTIYRNDATLERNLQNSMIDTSAENYTVHRSYETLVIHSPQPIENTNLSIRLASRNEDDSFNVSNSSLGRVRHSPLNTSRSEEVSGRSSVYSDREVSSIQRTYGTLHQSVKLPHQLDFRPIRQPTTQEKLAASKIVAVAKGYLDRKLMKTELAQNMITTIAETLKTAIDLRNEIQNLKNNNMPVPQADLDLHDRLIYQLESEHESFYSLFSYSSAGHRMAVLAADRERVKSISSRPPSGQRPLSSATQRSLKRKQEPDPDPTPRSSLAICRRSSRRPLWETTASSGRHVSSAPGWVGNPRPPQAKPLPRKPWR